MTQTLFSCSTRKWQTTLEPLWHSFPSPTAPHITHLKASASKPARRTSSACCLPNCAQKRSSQRIKESSRFVPTTLILIILLNNSQSLLLFVRLLTFLLLCPKVDERNWCVEKKPQTWRCLCLYSPCSSAVQRSRTRGEECGFEQLTSCWLQLSVK